MTQPRRTLRIALIGVAAVIVAAVGIGVIVVGRIDPNKYKPDIAAAVKRATGRDLALNGAITLKPSLWPTIQVQDVALSNPPGFSRPQMASLQGLELQLALIPLLSSRIQVDRLVLIHPDILLETDAAGHPNWLMTPEASPAAPAGTQPQAQPGTGTRTEVSVASIRIQDGSIAYRDGRTAKVTTLGLPKLEASAASPDSPLQINADALFNGTAFNLAGDTGSLSRLQDSAATTPWPVKLRLTVGTAKLSADGSLTQPLQGKGYVLDVNGNVPDAAVLTPLLQGYKLPPLHDVTFAAKVADNGGPLPAFSALTLHVGASDLNAEVPGLTLDHLDIAAAAADQPAKASAAGKLGDQPLSLAATTGALAGLMPNAKPAPLPIDATIQAAGATFTIKGTIANAAGPDRRQPRADGRYPRSCRACPPWRRRPLPAIKQIKFQGTLTDATPAGLRSGAALHGLALTTADGDLAGDATIGLTPKTNIDREPSVQSHRPRRAADGPGPKPVPRRRAAAGTTPPATAPAAATEAQRPPVFRPAHPVRPAAHRRRRPDAGGRRHPRRRRRLQGDQYPHRGQRRQTHRQPIRGRPARRALSGTATVDATQAAPPVHIVLHAPGLALKTVLAAAHEPSFATGNLEVYADLRGAGATPHAIAATLDGSLGLAIPGGHHRQPPAGQPSWQGDEHAQRAQSGRQRRRQ